MSRRDAATEPAVGFLTVVSSEPHGLLGGYLVLNALGRPLEFHCTAPLKPNRAQEILYGATLESYLYGEQIGRTLLSAAKIEVSLVCTDLAPALAVAELVKEPVVLVLSGGDAPASDSGDGDIVRRIDGRHGGPRPTTAFHAGRFRVALSAGREADRARVVASVERLGESLDLCEPFARIRDAIAEAQRSGR